MAEEVNPPVEPDTSAQPNDSVSTPATSSSDSGSSDTSDSSTSKPDSASSSNSASADNVSASNPSMPPEDSNIPNDGRTATGAQVGAPAAPASGSPTQAPDGNSAAVENQTNPNAGTGAQVIGSVPDRVTFNNQLSALLSDLEAMVTRVRGYGNTFQTDKLEKHLLDARDWAADELGLEKTDAGWVAAGTGSASSTVGGVNQPAAQSGRTDSQNKAADSSKNSSSSK